MKGKCLITIAERERHIHAERILLGSMLMNIKHSKSRCLECIKWIDVCYGDEVFISHMHKKIYNIIATELHRDDYDLLAAVYNAGLSMGDINNIIEHGEGLLERWKYIVVQNYLLRKQVEIFETCYFESHNGLDMLTEVLEQLRELLDSIHLADGNEE